ncbi:MAG: zinc-binding dehydrogenase [Deltaproteobacteria bacterium]|nr:zinc-binding dehydrogenase [Deltaproteobacteria bacterium]
MRAIVINKHGGPEVLEWVDIPKPKLQSHETLVQIKACSLNHLDIWVRLGLPNLRLKYPHILGSDISGVLVGSGEEVVVCPGINCGQCEACQKGRDNECEKYGILGETTNGGYSQYIAVDSNKVVKKPKNLSFVEAASYPLTFMTAWHMLVAKAKIKKDDWVLVLASGSGVGSAAVQISKLFDAKVIATASTQSKLDHAKSLGADEVINYKEEDFSCRVREITQKRGVDIVFENTGKATWGQSIKSVKKYGVIVTCGATSGYEALLDLRHVFFRQLSILGSTMGTFDEFKKITKYMSEGKLKPVVDRVFPLEQAREAHQYLEDRKQFGKVVLTM